MGVYYSAKLVYGVYIDSGKISSIAERPDFDDIYDRWFIPASLYDTHEDVVVGIEIDSVKEAESAEVCVSVPAGKNFDKLLDILDELGIDQEPTWHLICQVS